MNIQYTYHQHEGSAGDSPNGCYTTADILQEPQYSTCTLNCSIKWVAFNSQTSAWAAVCPTHGIRSGAMNLRRSSTEQRKIIEKTVTW